MVPDGTFCDHVMKGGITSGIVYPDAVADLELEAVTREDFLEWRDRILQGRQARTVNRYVRSVVAALNQATDLGYLGNPAAWKLKALSDGIDETGETAVFLDATQRKAMIAAASPAAARFLRGLELTGARPKELAATLVVDFDGHTLRLAHRKGRPAKLRRRHVVLSAQAIEFFNQQSKDKLPGAPLLPRTEKHRGVVMLRHERYRVQSKITIGTPTQRDESRVMPPRTASAMPVSASCYKSMESTQ